MVLLTLTFKIPICPSLKSKTNLEIQKFLKILNFIPIEPNKKHFPSTASRVRTGDPNLRSDTTCHTLISLNRDGMNSHCLYQQETHKKGQCKSHSQGSNPKVLQNHTKTNRKRLKTKSPSLKMK